MAFLLRVWGSDFERWSSGIHRSFFTSRRVTTVYHSWSVDVIPTVSLPCRRQCDIFLPEREEMWFQQLGVRFKPEMTSPFDFGTPIWYRSGLKIFVHLSPFKSNWTFSTCIANCHLKILGIKKIFIIETRRRHFLIANRVVCEISV